MANYKNQNVITDISVEKIKHQSGIEESWMQPFSWDKMMIPLFLLNGNEYKVYMYIFKWAGQGYYEYSPADIEKSLDIKEDTARKIFKKLIEYGYLTYIASRKYKFDPYPDVAKQKYYEKYGKIFSEKVV